jgi:hypothetical protein
MTFWDKRFGDDDLPPELKGKKPEDIAAAIKKAQEIEASQSTQAEELRKAQEALTARNSEFETMKAKLADIEARSTSEPEDVANEPASPWIDPDKYVAKQTEGTTAVALAAGLMSAKLYFMQGLTARDQRIFKKYEKEVEQFVNTQQPMQRVMPQTWQNMLLYVKGLHEQEIAKAESTSTDFFSETASRSNTPEPEVTDKLTAEEEEICRTFHYDPVSYLANKKSGVMSSSAKGAYARYAVPTTK